MSGNQPAAARTINLVKDPTGAPAVNLTKVREAGHVDLVKRAEKAGISLSKRNLSGLRGAVRLYVDHSGSMEFPQARDYTNGNVQRLVERALGYAFQLDSDGVIPVIAFDHRLWPEVVAFGRPRRTRVRDDHGGRNPNEMAQVTRQKIVSPQEPRRMSLGMSSIACQYGPGRWADLTGGR